MRFLFKYPTRGRPDMFKSTLTKWIEMLSGKHSYQFLVTVDNDDWSMETPEMGIFLDNARYTDVYYAEPATKVDAINRDIDMAQPFDIIVLVSDDMIPEIVGYDDEIAHDMEKYFPMFDGALHYNDGSTIDKLITLSIMGVRLYEYFGYIYNPEYNSLWCDNEFTDVVRNMKKCVYSPRTIIRHKWQHHGNDETYKKSEAAYQADNRTYTRRKEAGFPIPKKVERPITMKDNNVYMTWCISNNLGDAINVYLCRKITGQTPVYVPPGDYHTKYMMTGSILNHADKDTIVWGAGIANSNDVICPKADIRSVRGPYTRQRILTTAGAECECPEVYGDPALLMPRFYNPDMEVKYEVGIIPHYVNQVEVLESLPAGAKFINVFDDIENIVDQVKQCKTIFSSSLHGLVLADAYGVPSLWFEGSNPLGGDGTKFLDHFASVGIEPYKPMKWYFIDMKMLGLNAVVDTEVLWQACPL